jgi:murein DD-endopeptidase MepM/ murein hydrolase activator NlpD
MKTLRDILHRHLHFEKVIASPKPYRKLDFSITNKDLLRQDLTDTRAFSAYVFNTMLSENQFIGIGGYDENRVIYRQRDHFTNQDHARSIHLGTDIWAEAGEPVYVPLAGEVHSFAYNNQFGDFGPTIVLKHALENVTFYTLYGHLSLNALDGLFPGKIVTAGDKLATIGSFPENGDWPPHLHFQLISDMGELRGDFPGVSSIQDREHFLSLCPDPNLILRIDI